MTRASDDTDDDGEIHPQYDVSAHIEELFSVPVYRQPENPLIERWREIGERLLALGERHLIQGVDEADTFLQGKLEERRRRRERRAAKRRAARAAQQAQAAAAATAAAAAA
ncbi:MAG TPA: hypothetical protein VK932_13230, partial [Kofleriaceae bacterium]|nr:hypothetical protein [Kofleriaceae bacterium]